MTETKRKARRRYGERGAEPQTLYAITAYVRGEEWMERQVLGVFSREQPAILAYAAWIAGDGPRQIDPGFASDDDPSTHCGYTITSGQLNRVSMGWGVTAWHEDERVEGLQ